jgi:hypothetical protein
VKLKSNKAVLLQGGNSWCTWFLPSRYRICGKETLVKIINGTVMAIEMIRSIHSILNGKPVQSIPTTYLRSSVFQHGIKRDQFVYRNEILDFLSAG